VSTLVTCAAVGKVHFKLVVEKNLYET